MANEVRKEVKRVKEQIAQLHKLVEEVDGQLAMVDIESKQLDAEIDLKRMNIEQLKRKNDEMTREIQKQMKQIYSTERQKLVSQFRLEKERMTFEESRCKMDQRRREMNAQIRTEELDNITTNRDQLFKHYREVVDLVKKPDPVFDDGKRKQKSLERDNEELMKVGAELKKEHDKLVQEVQILKKKNTAMKLRLQKQAEAFQPEP